MKHTMVWHLLAGCLLQCLWQLSATAEEIAWRDWFVQQVNRHPDIVAAQENLNAGYSLAEGLDLPVYNPELFGNFADEGDNENWRVGLGQTLDIYSRRNAQEDQAAALRDLSTRSYRLVWQEQAGRVLTAMVAHQAALDRYTLALEQEEQLDIIIDLMRRRQQAGDLGQIDVEMTLLSLSRRLNDTARSLARYKQAEAVLRELLMTWDPARVEVPVDFWGLVIDDSIDDRLLEHPAVLAAEANWQALERSAVVVDRARKAEPTLALEGGKEGSDDAWGVSISVPLNVRNNYDAQVRAARQQALAAKSEYRAVLRRQRFEVDAATIVALQYRDQYKRWQEVVSPSSETSGNLLLRQWEEGDLGTNEYLILLQQRIDGLLASIQLAESYRYSLINWLIASGRITAELNPSSKFSVQTAQE